MQDCNDLCPHLLSHDRRLGACDDIARAKHTYQRREPSVLGQKGRRTL